jgi:hypothetical protein
MTEGKIDNDGIDVWVLDTFYSHASNKTLELTGAFGFW